MIWSQAEKKAQVLFGETGFAAESYHGDEFEIGYRKHYSEKISVTGKSWAQAFRKAKKLPLPEAA